MPEQVGQAVARERLRGRLVDLRRRSGLTPEQVIAQTHWSLSKLNRIETGSVTVQALDVQALLRLYAVDDAAEVRALTELAVVARRRQWWSSYRLEAEDREFVACESAASRITVYQALLIPDLLRTEAYSRAALISTAGKKPDDPGVQRRLDLTTRRQAELAARMRGPEPPRLLAVLDGAVLERRVGGRAVMRAQLDRLLELVDGELVRITVVPLAQGVNPGAGGGFELLEFPGVEDPDAVFVEAPVHDFLTRDKDVTDHYHDVADRLAECGLTRDAAIREIRRVRGSL